MLCNVEWCGGEGMSEIDRVVCEFGERGFMYWIWKGAGGCVYIIGK